MSIKSLAAELGVSEQAIRAWCVRNKVAKDAKNRWVINNATEEAIRKHYRNRVAQDEQETQHHSQACASDNNELVEELRKQIEFLRDQNAELLKSLQAEQALRAQEVGKMLETSTAKRSRWQRLKEAWRG